MNLYNIASLLGYSAWSLLYVYKVRFIIKTQIRLTITIKCDTNSCVFLIYIGSRLWVNKHCLHKKLVYSDNQYNTKYSANIANCQGSYDITICTFLIPAKSTSKRFSVTNFCILASQLSPHFSDLLLFAEIALRMMPPLFLSHTNISHRLWTYVQAERLQYVLSVCAVFLMMAQYCQSWKHGLGGVRRLAYLFVVLQTDAGFPGCLSSKWSSSA